MFKAAGFLAGFGVVVAAFLMLIGPQQKAQLLAMVQPEASVVTPAAATDGPPAVTPADPPPPAAVPQVAPGLPQEQLPVPGGESADEAEPEDSRMSVSLPVAITANAMEPGSATITTPVTVPSATAIYRFWSPFRSEWAAAGFAGRLTQATDVPVEVFREGPTEYRVGFSYQDEAERQARMSRIETITGLEIGNP